MLYSNRRAKKTFAHKETTYMLAVADKELDHEGEGRRYRLAFLLVVVVFAVSIDLAV